MPGVPGKQVSQGAAAPVAAAVSSAPAPSAGRVAEDGSAGTSCVRSTALAIHSEAMRISGQRLSSDVPV